MSKKLIEKILESKASITNVKVTYEKAKAQHVNNLSLKYLPVVMDALQRNADLGVNCCEIAFDPSEFLTYDAYKFSFEAVAVAMCKNLVEDELSGCKFIIGGKHVEGKKDIPKNSILFYVSMPV